MKKNRILNTIITNYKLNKRKVISSDYKNKITWNDLIKLSYQNSEKIKKINQKYIPIVVDRNIKTLISIVSVIFAGKVFCPISDALPDKKILSILIKLNSRFLINCSNKKIGVKTINISTKVNAKNNICTDSFLEKKLGILDEKNELYVLFTSGSTGDPKGVILSYENILNTLLWSKYYLKWKSKDIIGVATSFSFDISIFDLFTSLYFNVPTYIFKNPSNSSEVLKEIKKFKISSIFAVPSFFSNFVRYNLLNNKIKYLRQIISGGDFFPHYDLLRWIESLPFLDIYNVWGPTETSIVNSMYKIKNKDLSLIKNYESLPVGKSQKKMEILLLDSKNKIISNHNTNGEIVMIGKCVSKGYIGDIQNQKNYMNIKNKNAFLTGDIGYFDKKKYLHIVGRKDNTLKISGFRVDSKEIEIKVNLIKNVINSYVFATTIQNKYSFLCLCVLAKKKIEKENIKKKLRDELPEYSIPKYIIFVKKFPLNSNGKIDKKKLQESIVNAFF